MKKLKVWSLFCWCGGSDLWVIGNFRFLWKKYEELPFEINFAVDIDEKAIATYNNNFSHKALVMWVEDCNKKNTPDIDLLMGWFPCQSFSTVNPTKNPFDERWKLYKHMARILKEKKPKAFIAENVKGLMVLKNGSIFENIIKEFEKQGYNISHKLLNAANFGIPQKRQRVFIVWIRKDLWFKFEFPEATHHENPKGKQDWWVGLKNVIDSLIPNDDKYYFSQKAVEWMRKAKNNMKRGLFQDLENPCLTVTSHLAKTSLNSRDPVLLVNKKKDLYRRFTPREAARIQSFPDTFTFVGSEWDAYRQIWNAIAPLLMRIVSKTLSDQLLKKKKQ